ncbi:hypothetical protein C4559_05670 [Candidatus Microgenomates bacterium]|nr:MAG: hypothetical protein C4559_05670 [Candidatus Microgenomates bacterium]
MKKPIRHAQGKHFYSHLIETSSISLELGEMDLSKEERVHLTSLVETNVHYVILDVVLSHLEEEDKKTFLKHLAQNEHEKVWDLLKDKIENIEEKIKKAANDLKEELYKDIKEIKS